MKRSLLDVLEASVDTNDSYKVYTTDRGTCTGRIIEVGADFVLLGHTQGRTVIAREHIIKGCLQVPEA